jgi:hypothetical protein
VHSSTCHCICLLHNLLNVLVQIANKMGFKKKTYLPFRGILCLTNPDCYLIWTTYFPPPPKLPRISEGLLYCDSVVRYNMTASLHSLSLPSPLPFFLG